MQFTDKDRKTETAKREILWMKRVANSEAIRARLPTLRELIGYTTLSSVFLHSLRNDVDNDINRGDVDESIREIRNDGSRDADNETDLTRSPRNRTEEMEDDSWLRQASESKAISPNGEDVTLEERTLVTTAIQENGDGREKSSTRTYPKPTTMRGIPLAKLTPSSQGTMRGFYVTRSGNDLPTMPMPANDFTICNDPPHVTTYRSTERQQTETTLIPDISTTDDIVTVASESGQHEAVRSGMPNNHANSIVNDKVIDNLKEDSPSPSELPLEDSDSAENLSDYREIDIVTTLARSASKRGKSLNNFDDDAALSHNAHVISTSTTPTRRKIALVVSRYNEATTPLWTGKRIVIRKRNRNTLSSIKEAIRRTKSDFAQTTASVLKNAFGTFATSSTSTTPAIGSESMAEASEALNTHRNFANFTDKAAEDSEKRTATEATIDATAVIISTPMDDSTIITMPSTIMTTSLIAAAKASAATTDGVITTTPSATTRIETVPEIANYSAITVPIIAELNSNEFATVTTPIAAQDTELDGVSTIANYKIITMNSMTVNPHKFTTDSAHGSTLETTSAAVETAYTTANYSTLAIPAITNAHAATTIPAVQTLPLTPTVTSTTNLRINTIAPATTHDIVDINTDITRSTITPATVINPTTIDTNVTVTFASANANLSLAVTSAMADTTVPDVNSTSSVSTGATLASLTVPDQVSSTESSTISSITPDLSFHIDGKDLEKLSVPATAESIATTEFSTMFETSPTLTISQSLSTINPETSTTVTMVTTAFPIQTDDSLVVTSTEAQTLPIFFSNAKIATVDATTRRSSIATDATTPSITSRLDSVQTTDKEAILSEMSIERALKEDVIATLDQTVNRTNINERNSLQTANEERTTLPETKATSDESASKNVENRGGNQTASQLRTNDHVLGQKKASRRRVLNRTNNWIGSPVTQHSTRDNHYPRRRVTIYRHRGRPSDYISSSRVIEENLGRRNMQKRLRINSKAISSTVRPENISEEYTVHKSTKNVTRRMKVVLKRIKEKMTEENATISPVEETTAFVRSSAYTENKTLQARRKNVGRRRQVVLKRLKPPQSGENSTTGEIGADSDFVDENLSNKSQSNLRAGEAFVTEGKNTRRRMRLVLKSIRPKSEEKNTTEQTSADSDRADKSFRNINRTNNFYASDNLSPQEGDARKRMRVVSKSVGRKSKERNVTIEEANTNFRFQSTNARSTQDDPPRNFRTSENVGTEGKTRRRMRVVLRRRVKPKFKEQKTVEFGRANENTTDESASSGNHREGKDLFYQYRTRRRRRKVEVSKSAESKSETNSMEEASEHLFDEEGTKEQQMRIALDSVKPKFAEKDSIAEETNMDLEYGPFAVKEPRITFPFDFSNNFPVSEKIVFVNELSNMEQARKGVESNYKNEGTTIEQSKGFDAKLPTESVAQVEEDTDRSSLEVNSSNNGGSVSRKTGNGYPNRHRKPTQSTTTVASPTNSIPPNTHRRGTPIETTVSPKIQLGSVDVFENTESYAKQSAEDDQKTDVSDQSIRAQEFAVTVADPPSSNTVEPKRQRLIRSLRLGRTPLRDAVRRKISTTVAPRTYPTTGRTVSKYDADSRDRQRPRTKNRPTVNATTRPRRPPVIDYDYYEDEAPIVIGKSALGSKLFLTSKGTIRCLDQGNFPHPYSCKKFITCARMVNGQVIGTEYTCPDKLSFDPVGGICNWSAGLGCKD
ncbi:hypothetical protein DMN91_001733 [Ooceraea biroi]|uniref:Chitin-binding type-2 domain-containing protein n=1 Tax=Ooceraea biroi TaxID=2015173 RepID=A0A3L8DYZ9_OOCBI|nr:hypothetical protein DMN91_001733 [Ooceraea biroi]